MFCSHLPCFSPTIIMNKSHRSTMYDSLHYSVDRGSYCFMPSSRVTEATELTNSWSCFHVQFSAAGPSQGSELLWNTASVPVFSWATAYEVNEVFVLSPCTLVIIQFAFGDSLELKGESREQHRQQRLTSSWRFVPVASLSLIQENFSETIWTPEEQYY